MEESPVEDNYDELHRMVSVTCAAFIATPCFLHYCLLLMLPAHHHIRSCFEEVQRLRQKNDRTKEELISQASPPLRADKHYDTSTTASLSTESSEESGSGVFIQVPKSILKNRPGHDSSSNLDGSDQGSDGTTTFSYDSSLSGSSFSAGLSSASSVYGDYGKRPRGILRRNSHSSRGSSRNSRSSDGRVVFAGRDHVINLQFDV